VVYTKFGVGGVGWVKEGDGSAAVGIPSVMI
jgi:hypothetical protein